MPDKIDSIPQLPANTSAIAPGTTDRAGAPFDPARHVAKQHPRTGRWMPRGGRKPKTASSSSVSTSPSQASTAGTAAQPEPLPPSSPSPADSPAPLPFDAPAPSFADIEKAAGPVAPAPADPAAEAKAKDAQVELMESADDVAEIVSNGIYNLVGFIFDAPEEWGLAGAEHNRARKAIAAYVRSRGGQISPGKALVILAAAYLLRGLAKPKSKAKAKEWTAQIRASLFAKSRPVQPVAPVVEPVPVVEPAAPVVVQPSNEFFR